MSGEKPWRELLQADVARQAKAYLEKDKARGFLKSLARHDFKAGAQPPNERLVKLIEALEHYVKKSPTVTRDGERTFVGDIDFTALKALADLRKELGDK